MPTHGSVCADPRRHASKRRVSYTCVAANQHTSALCRRVPHSSSNEFERKQMTLSTAVVDEDTFLDDPERFGREARLSWVLAGLAGLLGATAFTHSAGYFLT